MSFHNKPNYQIPELIEALKAHRLPNDTPSQLADSFRIGWMACRELARADSVLEDTARLDWLDKQIKVQDLYTGFVWRAEGSYEENMGLVGKVQAKKEKMTARQAIDAARKQGASHAR